MSAIGPRVSLQSSNGGHGGAVSSGPVSSSPLSDLALPVGLAATVLDLGQGFAGANLVFSLAPISDPLPAGLSFDASAVLAGTPTEAVTRNLVIRAANSQGSADATLVLTTFDLALTADLSGLTDNLTHGPSAETGVTLTATLSGANGPPPGPAAYQWKTLESGPIAGATAATFVPDAAMLDSEQLYCTLSATPYPDVDTPTAVVRHQPPQAAGALMDEIFDLGTGPQLVATAADFSGSGLVFSATGPGVSIDSQTAVMTIATDTPVFGATVTVTATNSGGAAVSGFLLTVEAEGTAPVLSALSLNEAAGEINFNVDLPSLIYWRRDPLGTNPDGAAIISGGGHDSGSFSVSGGLAEYPVTFATGNDGLQQLSVVAALSPPYPSNVETVSIEIETTPPVLATSVPAPGAAGIAVAVQPVLTFSEPVVPGSGTVTIFDVTNGQVHDTISTLQEGTGPGTLRITGPDLEISPTLSLAFGRNYAIQISPGALSDLAGNSFAGITDTSTLAFETVTSSSGPLFSSDFSAQPPTAIDGLMIAQLSATGALTLDSTRAPLSLPAASNGAWALDSGADFVAERLRFRVSDSSADHRLTIRAEAVSSFGSAVNGFALSYTDDAGTVIGAIDSTDVPLASTGASGAIFDGVYLLSLPAGATAVEFEATSACRWSRLNVFIHDLTLEEI